MANLKGAIEIGGVLCLPISGEGHRYYYLPLSAGLQKNPDGSVQAQLLAAGSIAFLQITTIWGPEAEGLEAVRADLAQREGLSPDDPVVLSFAPVTQVEAKLSVQIGPDAHEVARSQSAGSPPYAAFFSKSLSDAERGAVTSAMNGERGKFFATYTARLAWPSVHTAVLTGRLGPIHSRTDLEAALQDGRATLAFPAESAALSDAFMDRAVEMLSLSALVAEAETRLEIELTVEETSEVRAGADLGDWFEPGDAPLIPTINPVISPATGPSDGGPPATADHVSISADLRPYRDLIAFVALDIAGETAQLTPEAPNVTIPLSTSGATLSVATTFLSGGAPFTTERPVPEGGDVVLGPDELGVLAVRIDPTPLAEAGFDEARATLRFRPESSRDRATETFRFHAPFAAALWPIVTRGAPLGDALTFEARASGPGGARLRIGETVAETPDITLSPTPQNED